MLLNGIWMWGSSSEYLGSVKHPYIAITPKTTLTWSGSTCFKKLFIFARILDAI